MRHLITFMTAFLLSINAFNQINVNDSTFQAIGYWDKGEKQSYTISHENFKVESSDTIERERWQYSVDISIVDSTANSYTIDWFYHDYVLQTESELLKKLLAITENITIRIKTDELGAFIEIVNWEIIKQNIYRGLTLLKDDFKNIPQMDKVIEQVESLYSTKESIEASAIKEIQQFYSYHGARYKLGQELKSNIKQPNLYNSNNPFDTEVILYLDDMNTEDNNAVIRMRQIVDSTQLKKATFDYMVRTAETLGTEAPKWEDFPPLKNEIWLASRIHGSGWIIYSIETREVTAEGTINVQNRIIEIE
jgi:hypothetical protein